MELINESSNFNIIISSKTIIKFNNYNYTQICHNLLILIILAIKVYEKFITNQKKLFGYNNAAFGLIHMTVLMILVSEPILYL